MIVLFVLLKSLELQGDHPFIRQGERMKPEDRKRLKQHIEMIVDHKTPAELSSVGKIKRALTVARLADVGCELSRFDVIELSGFIADMEEDSALSTHELAAYQLRIRELEARWKIAETDVMDIVGSALSGDCEKYQYFDRNGNRYVRWGIVGNDLRAVFYNHTDIVDEMSVGVKNTNPDYHNPDYYNRTKTSTDNNKCWWTQESDPEVFPNLWRAGCGNSFYLDAEKPSDNHMKYCCYCGKEIAEGE